MTSSKIWGFQTPPSPLRHLPSLLLDPQPPFLFPNMIFGKTVFHGKIEKSRN